MASSKPSMHLTIAGKDELGRLLWLNSSTKEKKTAVEWAIEGKKSGRQYKK